MALNNKHPMTFFHPNILENDPFLCEPRTSYLDRIDSILMLPFSLHRFHQ